MALPSKPSAISQRARASNCSMSRWPKAVHFALWSYTLRNAVRRHNSLPVLEDSTLRLELFSLICVGSNMKHVHTFGCPVFALQNALASGNQLPCWSPCARILLNFGPSPMHARDVYLVLNLVTQCVLPQYHCRFDNFIETTCHGAPDVSSTICWQQLANLDCASMILSKVSMPKQHSIISSEMPSEEDTNTTTSEPFFEPLTYDNTSDDYSISDADLLVSENSRTSRQTQASHTNEGVTPAEPTVTVGTSQPGRVCTMSQRMAESVSQRNFYGDQSMHYMSSQTTTSKMGEDLFQESHLQFQEQIRNPIAFHAEMMGDIMYLQQELRQPNMKEFVQAVIKKVNGHVDCSN